MINHAQSRDTTINFRVPDIFLTLFDQQLYSESHDGSSGYSTARVFLNERWLSLDRKLIKAAQTLRAD